MKPICDGIQTFHLTSHRVSRPDIMLSREPRESDDLEIKRTNFKMTKSILHHLGPEICCICLLMINFCTWLKNAKQYITKETFPTKMQTGSFVFHSQEHFKKVWTKTKVIYCRATDHILTCLTKIYECLTRTCNGQKLYIMIIMKMSWMNKTYPDIMAVLSWTTTNRKVTNTEH